MKVYNSKDQLITTTSLENAQYDLKSIKSKKIYCKLTWTAANVPNDDSGYSFEVTTRGKLFFKTSDLLLNGWSLDGTLGD